MCVFICEKLLTKRGEKKHIHESYVLPYETASMWQPVVQVSTAYLQYPLSSPSSVYFHYEYHHYHQWDLCGAGEQSKPPSSHIEAPSVYNLDAKLDQLSNETESMKNENCDCSIGIWKTQQ